MIGVPLIAAPSDEEAQFLASSVFQRVLGILHGDRRCLPPPVEDFMAGLHPQERAGIADFLGAAVIGGPDSVQRRFGRTAAATQADEFIAGLRHFRSRRCACARWTSRRRRQGQRPAKPALRVRHHQ
jgi:alkanesulfonate monooxygenase SsuD/methylene tetrahydromethanopterin reductase-like flavin-dependent oxidoreductase (luciferase family)